MYSYRVRMMCLSALSFPILLFGQAPESFKIIPERVLARDGTIVSRKDDAVPFPSHQGVGKVFEETISHKGKSVRLHFQIQVPTPRPVWSLRILDGSRQPAWSYSALDVPTDSASGKKLTEFWSGDIKGNRATIQLYSLDDSSPLKLLVDKMAVSISPIKPQAITPPDDRKPIINYPDFRPWGNAVARLRFIRDSGEYVCTGFLVSVELFLTNNHCISNEDEMRSALVEFGYDWYTSVPKTLQFREIVLSDFRLDYTLLRLMNSPGTTPLTLTAAAPSENQALLIIEHPGGEPKQVSIFDCKVHGLDIFGQTPERETPEKTDFGHLCDTLGGSSGSPVQDIKTGDVIGLHHLGFLPNSDLLVNQAVKMSRILDQIRRERPEIFSEIAQR